jgi:hypothetical protein
LGFITFGLEVVACGMSGNGAMTRFPVQSLRKGELNGKSVVIRGELYDVSKFVHPGDDEAGEKFIKPLIGKDVTFLFPQVPTELYPPENSACAAFGVKEAFLDYPCTVDGVDLPAHCHTPQQGLSFVAYACSL